MNNMNEIIKKMEKTSLGFMSGKLDEQPENILDTIPYCRLMQPDDPPLNQMLRKLEK